MTDSIRPLAGEDRAAWEALWSGYLAVFDEDPAAVTETTWARLTDPSEPVHAIGLFRDGDLLGIAQYVLHRHTWTVGDLCFLADLFTRAGARGCGIGTALVEAVFERARAAGAICVYGMTAPGNAAARSVYDRVAERFDQVVYRKVLV